MSNAIVTNGVVAFSNLQEFDTYKGQSTGRYSLVITMDDKDASVLSDMGVKVKEYAKAGEEPKKQRKFASKYKVDIVDMNNEPIQTEIPFGSKVRVLWATGDAHPVHGAPTYLNKVRVVEMAETSALDEVPPEF